MNQRLALIAKFALILNIIFLVYGYAVSFLISFLEKSQSFQSPEEKVIFPRLVIFITWFLTSPFVYYFVYKTARSYVLKNPVLNAKGSKISFGVWIVILNSIFTSLWGLLKGIIPYIDIISSLAAYPFFVAIVVCEIAAREKPSIIAHTIGVGILLLMFVGVFIAGLISG